MNKMDDFLQSLAMGVMKVYVDSMADKYSAENFVTTRRSVVITGIGEHRIDLEHKGKNESLQVTVSDLKQLLDLYEAMKSGKKLDLVIGGQETSRTGERRILTARILEMKGSSR